MSLSVAWLVVRKYQFTPSIDIYEISIIVVAYALGLVMHGILSVQREITSRRYYLRYVLYNRLSQIITLTGQANAIAKVLSGPFLFTMMLCTAIPYSEAYAQHMMMPPAASLGDRKIALYFHTDPTNIISNQTVLTKLAFTDQNTKQTLKHVTVRMEITDTASGRRLLSEFFHAHNGSINIDFRPAVGLKYVVTGNMDDLTNAWVADPGSPIIVNGPIFSQPGDYRIRLEVTTIDNDKTDLPQPLTYDLNIPIS